MSKHRTLSKNAKVIHEDNEPPKVVFACGTSTNNPHEVAAAIQLTQAGYEVYRAGWPDFLAVKDGKLVFVEVKPTGASKEFHGSQKDLLAILRDAGLDVRVLAPLKKKPTQPPDALASKILTDIIGDAKGVGILIEADADHKAADEWLPDFIAAMNGNTVISAAYTRGWNAMKKTHLAAASRSMTVENVRPRRGVPVSSLHDYELAAFQNILAKAHSLIVIVKSISSPSHAASWALATARGRGIPFAVLEDDYSRFWIEPANTPLDSPATMSRPFSADGTLTP